MKMDFKIIIQMMMKILIEIINFLITKIILIYYKKVSKVVLLKIKIVSFLFNNNIFYYKIFMYLNIICLFYKYYFKALS
jgi:hypothetical protein